MVKVIVLTGQNDQANALRAVALGAYDFLAKPFEPEVLALTIDRAFRLYELQAENHRLSQLQHPDALGGLITRDPDMLRIARMIERVSGSDATVLLLGESGTGKEVLAQGLHAASKRTGRFIAINCAAIPENLLESELFGYEKGAFTGATKTTPGKFETANGGTLMLDEIGDLPHALQAKLLRFLQERTVERLGGRSEIPVDVRVVGATHQDLKNLIAQGKFREDLYYRLNVFPITIPPLRERGNDIVALADYFVSRFSQEMGIEVKRISTPALNMLTCYHWPGNVRELENAIERAVILTTADVVDRSALPDRITERRAQPLVSERVAANPTLDTIERAYIMWVLQTENGNKTRAAEVLGIDPSTLHRKLSRFGVDS